MAMISVNEFKNSLTVGHNNGLWRIVELQHAKPGKDNAFVYSELESLRTGAVQDYAFHSTERVNTTDVRTKPMQYLYNGGADYIFMDMNTYKQLEVLNSRAEREPRFLKENMEVNVIMHENGTLGIDLLNTVDPEITGTEPDIRGDTSSGGGKPATIETGLVADVPFFISADDILTINTSNGSYVSRTSE